MVRKTIDEINYYYVMIIVLPVWAGLAAVISEGQNFMIGLSSQRHWYGISGIFVIIYLLQTRFITIGDLYRALIWLGWGTMIYFIMCYLFLDPKAYLDYSLLDLAILKVDIDLNLELTLLHSFQYTIRLNMLNNAIE